jgi:hypothetical protein
LANVQPTRRGSLDVRKAGSQQRGGVRQPVDRVIGRFNQRIAESIRGGQAVSRVRLQKIDRQVALPTVRVHDERAGGKVLRTRLGGGHDE